MIVAPGAHAQLLASTAPPASHHLLHLAVLFVAWRALALVWLLWREDRHERTDPLSQQRRRRWAR